MSEESSRQAVSTSSDLLFSKIGENTNSDQALKEKVASLGGSRSEFAGDSLSNPDVLAADVSTVFGSADLIDVKTDTHHTFDPLAGLTIKDEHLARGLRGEDILMLDGAMGTQLWARGLATAGELPDLLNISRPEEIIAVHADYVAAGAEIITSNTFGANAHKLGNRATVQEVYSAAVSCARAAGARYVGGNIGPTGTLLEPMGTMTFEEAYDIFAEQVEAAQKAGCDIILIETMGDLREAKAALLAARECSTLPVLVTMTFGEDGRTFLGTPPEVAATMLSSMGAHLVGLNCSLGPDELLDVARIMASHARCPLVVRPNAGMPRVEDGQTVYDVAPQEFAHSMRAMLDVGAGVVGGCCGTGPDHIAELRNVVDSYKAPIARDFVAACAITSAQDAVFIEPHEACVAVVGERINPTGKRVLQQALRSGDFDYLVGEAVSQQEAGANLLDVNVGMPDIDEPTALRLAVEKLQATVTLPLVVDSSDPEALESAVRGYAGKPLINSVNGKEESLQAVLPLVKKYGCSVIALTLDEGGIPAHAEGRLKIAQRIIESAEAHGVPRQDVVVDCLAMAAATNQDEVREVLRAISLVKETLGVRTVLGVSNVSFGMPQRNMVNATFLAAALGAGLDFPILNPLSARYRDTVETFRVLNGQDRGSVSFIQSYAQAHDPYDETVSGNACQKTSIQAGDAETYGKTQEAPHVSIAYIQETMGVGLSSEFDADSHTVMEAIRLVLSGYKAPMAQVTNKLLEHYQPLQLINGLFIPTLDEVGRRFDKGEFFLPQLMAAAEVVKVGFDTVKSYLNERAALSGDEVIASASQSGERLIVLATVKGDIHDIGKNIVKMLLENYGFEVIDLGRDVDPEEVVRVTIKQGATLVGLSALMTTTVKAMEETIKQLHRDAPDVKIMVGGAVLTNEFATKMGADYYGKDAAEAARIAERHFAG